ncbi:LGFP repeat-containing protein [Gordonia sp. DT30]|uniref:LGFP repeat-containing protein n=1 Tax=unclassified Gordonia (in: high G+C Gram-positive bacteria) TaxID=2657482 RepID=UPI003CEC4A83
MRRSASRRTAFVAGLFAVMLVAAACGDDSTSHDATPSQASSGVTTTSESSAALSEGASSGTSSAASSAAAVPTTVQVTGERDVVVTLSGPIAVKYASATRAQKDALAKPLSGDRNAGTRESGVVFQQFQGGVIVAKNDAPGTPAYIITSGKIRDAWNTERAPDGTPSLTGKNGSAGPLGVPTSDVTVDGVVQKVTFEHGTVNENTQTGAVTVTVNGKVVPAGLR